MVTTEISTPAVNTGPNGAGHHAWACRDMHDIGEDVETTDLEWDTDFATKPLPPATALKGRSWPMNGVLLPEPTGYRNIASFQVKRVKGMWSWLEQNDASGEPGYVIWDCGGGSRAESLDHMFPCT